MANERKEWVDINAADADELRSIEGIDEKRAALIVEYRATHGAFKTWEDLEKVVGVGDALVEKMKQEAVLGRALREIEAVEIEEVEVLSALAHLDLEAALAYEAAAETADQPELKDQLRKFAKDHTRHVNDLNEFLRDRGGRPIDLKTFAGRLILAPLSRMAKPLGPIAQVMMLLGNEQLTNLSYAAALDLDWDDPARKVLERNAGDEQRHLAWLSDKQDELSREIEETMPPPV